MNKAKQIEAMAKFEYWRDVEWRNGRAYGKWSDVNDGGAE